MPTEMTGQRDGLGYLRWTPTACRRCGYEQVDCTCIGGFVAPQTTKLIMQPEAEWVIRVNLGDVDGVTADEWMTFVMEAVSHRDPGFSGLISMMKEPVDGI